MTPPPMAMYAVYGAVWCLIGFYAAALFSQSAHLPRGHVLLSLPFLGIMCTTMVLVGGTVIFLLPGLLLGVLLYYRLRYGLRTPIARAAQPGRLVRGISLFSFLLVTLAVSIAASGLGFVVLWPVLVGFLFALFPRKLKRAMLKALPMGEHMGWDDAFPEKIKYHPRRRAGGFTLIEVVIAFAVLTISFAGLFSLAAGRQKLVAASERALITRLAAQSQIERVKSLPFNALKIGSSQNFEIQLPDRNREGTLSIEQTEDPNIKLICVLVADKHTMAIERIELVTLVVARERKGP